MKKIFLTFCVLAGLALLQAIGASAAAPNFSGKWKLDLNESSGLPAQIRNAGQVTMSVKQNTKELKVETRIPGRDDGGRPRASGRNGNGRPGGGMGRGGGRRGGNPGNFPGGGSGGRVPGDFPGDGQGNRGGNRGGMAAMLLGPPKAVYHLDGVETTAKAGDRLGGVLRLRARLASDGRSIDLAATREMDFQQNEFAISTEDHWELTHGGSVLRVNRTLHSPRGTQEFVLVFTR